jgi:hypothetical protein
MSIRSKGLVFAMEEAGITDVEASETKIAEGMSEIDSEALERNEEAAEIEDLEMAIEDAMEDADTLEDISKVMEDSVESGEGLSPEAAEMAEIAVEAICNRLGIRNKKILPAMESFGSSSSRLAATRIALEATEETKKSLLDTVIEAFKRLGDIISDFFQRLMGGLPKVESVSKALGQKLEKFEDKNPKTKILDNPGLAKLFGSKSGPASAFTNVEKNLKFISEYQANLSTYSGDLMSEFGQLESISFYKFKEKAEANKKFAESVVKSAESLKSDDLTNGETGFVLLDKKLVITQDEVSNEGGVSDPKVIFEYEEKGSTGGKTLEVLSASEMKTLLKAVDKTVADLKQIKSKGDPKKISAKFIDAINKAVKTTEKASKDSENKDQETADKLKYLKNQARNVSQLTTSIGRVYKDIPADAVRTCHTALKYIQLSMKQYGEQSADKAEGGTA